MLERNIRLLHETLDYAAERTPEKTALVAEGRDVAYRELQGSAASLAAALKARGLNRGDRVAIYMDNTLACAVTIYGALMADAVFMVVNPQTKSDKLQYVLNDSEATVLISDTHLQGVYGPVLPACATLKTVLVTGPAELPTLPGIAIERFDAVLAAHAGASPAYVNIATDLAALIYTSGSTGNPKGVMMTHQSMLFAATSLAQYIRLDDTDRLINLLPLAFDYGLYQLLMAVRVGATLVLERSFTYAAQIINRVASAKVTVFPGVPTVYATLREMHRRSPLCFPTVRRVTNTAADLPSEYHAVLREIFPNALIFRMYGLTECKRVCYLEPEMLDQKPTSVGKAIPGTEVFLLSPEGEPVPPNTRGILHIRGPHVMLGYWKQPELSRKMLKPGRLPGESVLCSQDWFTMDEEGCLYFQGRSDDIIKTRGEKVSPVEVENVLYAIPGIKTAAVIGVPDELLGQAIKAFVVLETGAEVTESLIRKTCSARLENFMVPKFIEFRDSIETTSTGKITKKGLA